jgi:fumarate reductase subunit D
MKRRLEPFWWTLFSAGGTLSAFILPALILIFGIFIPLGWLRPPEFAELEKMIEPVFSRIFLFIVISLSLFHWAHRFRFTLYDGLQLQNFDRILAILCYGSAMVLSLFIGFVLWNF